LEFLSRERYRHVAVAVFLFIAENAAEAQV
jgi:uncharacterized membrane protein